MSVIYWQRKSAIGKSKKWDSTYTADFVAKTNSRLDGPQLVKEYARVMVPVGAPWVWANGEVDPNSFAMSHDVSPLRPEASLKVWLVRIGYEPPAPGEDPSVQNIDPTLRPWKARMSFVRTERPAYKDIDGLPLVNSVGQRIPTFRPHSNDTLVLEGYTDFIDLGIRRSTINRVNAATIWGMPKRCVRLDRWDADLEWENGGWYVHHVMEFFLSDEPINERPLDEGTLRCVNQAEAAANFAVEPIYTNRDTEDHALTKVPLDGGFVAPSGVRVGGVPINPAVDAPFYHNSKVLLEADFNLIGLPDPLPGPFV